MTTTYIGIELKDLPSIPVLNDSVFLVGQRPSEDLAEKFTLSNLNTYLDINTKITIKINDHLASSDPHGSNLYSSNLMLTHNNQVDAHGHKAFANGLIAAHLSLDDPHNLKPYVDTTMDDHLNVLDPHESRDYTDTVFSDHNEEADPHNHKAFANNLIATQRGANNGLAPLDSAGKVPSLHLPSTTEEVSFVTNLTLPSSGTLNKLYINTDTKKTLFWTGSNYQILSDFSSGGFTITTDDVSQGSDLNRRYFTTTIENTFNTNLGNKIENVVNVGASGFNVFRDKTGTNLNFKKLVAGVGMTITDTGNTLQLSSTSSGSIPDNLVQEEKLFKNLSGVSGIELTTDGAAATSTNILKSNFDGIELLEGTVTCLKILNQDLPTVEENVYNGYRVWKFSALIKTYFDQVTSAYITSILSQTLTEIHNTVETDATLNFTFSLNNNEYVFMPTNPTNLDFTFKWTFNARRSILEYLPIGSNI